MGARAIHGDPGGRCPGSRTLAYTVGKELDEALKGGDLWLPLFLSKGSFWIAAPEDSMAAVAIATSAGRHTAER